MFQPGKYKIARSGDEEAYGYLEITTGTGSYDLAFFAVNEEEWPLPIGDNESYDFTKVDDVNGNLVGTGKMGATIGWPNTQPQVGPGPISLTIGNDVVLLGGNGRSTQGSILGKYKVDPSHPEWPLLLAMGQTATVTGDNGTSQNTDGWQNRSLTETYEVVASDIS